MKQCSQLYKNFFVKMLLLFMVIMVCTQSLSAQHYTEVDPRPFADNSSHWYFGFDSNNLVNPLPGSPKYKTTDLVDIADNILLFQKDNGGWPKNYDIFAILTDLQKDSVRKARSVLNATYDNGSTYTHIAVLAN